METLVFESDPDIWKSLSKAEIWKEIQKDPILTKLILDMKKAGLTLEKPRMYRR